MTDEAPRCEHTWRNTGKREVRFCEECKQTEIKSLATLKWHPYISGTQIDTLQSEADALRGKVAVLTEKQRGTYRTRILWIWEQMEKRAEEWVDRANYSFAESRRTPERAFFEAYDALVALTAQPRHEETKEAEFTVGPPKRMGRPPAPQPLRKPHHEGEEG